MTANLELIEENLEEMISTIRTARSLRTLAFASMALGAVPAFSFTINATWGTGGAAFSSAQQADIQSAVNYYESVFTNNITVNIEFDNMSGGLGQSSTGYLTESYGTVHSALIANASGADDTAALAQLASNPVNNNTSIDMSTANAKALGLYSSSDLDGQIGLNAGICFSTHTSPVAGEYDLYAVACHEMDEVLGTVSGVGGSDMWTADLYRYNGSGQRSFTTNTSQHAYFSINGTTLLDEYNQYQHGNGDWGDWVAHSPGQVQDWVGSTGETIDPNTEFRLLDVVGYTRAAAAPEPVSTTLLAAGAIALIRRRRKH